MRGVWLTCVIWGLSIGPGSTQPPHLEFLPPEAPWDGASRQLMSSADARWATPFERSGGKDSPSYAETVAWLEELATATPRIRLVSLGASPEGRDLWMVVATGEGAATPEEVLANGRPTLMAQSGIHSGEIDGKDAGMMLLRDLTVSGRLESLLDEVNFLFVPIFSVDGHERRSPYGRANQRGPTHTGWRTTARNLNLNRDYVKLDTDEMRHMVTALKRWRPDLYLDLHVTDGADYQYDITWGSNGPHAWSPAIATWLDEVYDPAIAGALEEMGHIPGPLIFLDGLNPTRGLPVWTAGPRFSNGYGDARHLPTVLVENHSLKPFHQRVLGTYVLLEISLRILADEGDGLRRAIETDQRRRSEQVTLGWKRGDAPSGEISFRGIEPERSPSAVSGALRVSWTGRPVEWTLPLMVSDVPAVSAKRPTAYWIPPAWRDVIERLEIHGIELDVLAEPRTVEVEMYRFGEPQLADTPYEGRVQVTAEATLEKRTETFPTGSVRIATDQALGNLAMLLLEPASADSFFQWGFFHEILSRTEYVEGYVMEPMAERMLAEDPELAREFEARLAGDEEFRADPRARLQFFYQRTPYFDDHWRLYPVAREP